MSKLPSMIAVATALLALAASTATAAPRCTEAIEGQSGVQQALTAATDGATPARIKASYDRAFAKGRSEAIAAWSRKAAAACPGGRADWARAGAKSVSECDRAMGGRFTVCAKAVPR